MSEHTPYWKGVIRGYGTNGRDPWQVSVEMPEGPGIYDGTGQTVEFERGQVVHVLTDTGLAEVERAAAEKALTEAADDIDRRRSEPGLVHLDVKYAGYYAGIRSGMDSSSKALRTRSDSYRRSEGENE